MGNIAMALSGWINAAQQSVRRSPARVICLSVLFAVPYAHVAGVQSSELSRRSGIREGLQNGRTVLLAQAASQGGTKSDLNGQAQASFDQGDFQTAISLWTELIISNPDVSSLNDALSNRAKAYLVINQPALAYADLERVAIPLNQTKDLASLWLLKGTALLQMNNASQAVQAFNTSEKLVKGNADLYSNRSIALQMLGQWDAAKKDLRASIALDPSLSNYYNLAVLEKKLGNASSCTSLLTEIIKKSPEFSQAYLQRGLCSAMLGQHESAIADMLRVLKLDPNNVDAIEQTGRSLAASGNIEGARTYLLKASAIRLSLGQVEQYQNLLKTISSLGTGGR